MNKRNDEPAREAGRRTAEAKEAVLNALRPEGPIVVAAAVLNALRPDGPIVVAAAGNAGPLRHVPAGSHYVATTRSGRRLECLLDFCERERIEVRHVYPVDDSYVRVVVIGHVAAHESLNAVDWCCAQTCENLFHEWVRESQGAGQ